MPSLVIALALGLILAVTLRWHFERFGSTLSNRTEFAQVFPFITMTTILIITVVKSSLALSLGLVGALSIVRFRAAIKEPEELVYLFLCIAIGGALGAGHLEAGVSLVAVVTLFAVGRGLMDRGPARRTLLLTISGPAEGFGGQEHGVLSTLRRLADGEYTVQRLEVEDSHGLLRALLRQRTPDQAAALVSGLRSELPDCRLSYVDLDTVQ